MDLTTLTMLVDQRHSLLEQLIKTFAPPNNIRQEKQVRQCFYDSIRAAKYFFPRGEGYESLCSSYAARTGFGLCETRALTLQLRERR